MRVLLTNDDGPLDDNTCPYIKYLVDEIRRSTDWLLSIVVPLQQRLWIGKAHFAGATLLTTYLYTQDSTSSRDLFNNSFEGPFVTQQSQFPLPQWQEWCLLDSTPAACADIGIHYIGPESFGGQPVDLVLSGPNFGRNSSELYILTSGTVGAAMEAVTHGTKAIALSYAFDNLDHDFDILKEAARISVALVAKLYVQLVSDPKVDIYSVNVPLVPSLDFNTTRIHYAPILHNTWKSIYQPSSERNEHGQRQFVWQPDFQLVAIHGQSLKEHSDSRVLLDEGISVTPLNAMFKATPPFEGEIDIQDWRNGRSAHASKADLSLLEAAAVLTKELVALVEIPSNLYTFQLICDAFEKAGIQVSTDRSLLDKIRTNPDLHVYHYCEYEDIDLDLLQETPDQYMSPSYIYRKGITRKHYLNNTVRHYTSKNPSLSLAKAFPETFHLELDYAEFLDDALDEACELRHEIESGNKPWILKPSMSDKGQGIRIFRLVEQLQEIFDSFQDEEDEEEEEEEEEQNENEEEDEDEKEEEQNEKEEKEEKERIEDAQKLVKDSDQVGDEVQQEQKESHIKVGEESKDTKDVTLANDIALKKNTNIIISQLRHFVVQEYLTHPLLFPCYDQRKFHLRVYVVCAGDFSSYIYRNILALFAAEPYTAPSDGHPNMAGHLTNTCLQGEDALVVPFWEMHGWKNGEQDSVYAEICSVIGGLFAAATSANKLDFQPLRNAVEIYGIDAMLSNDHHVTLLEANAYPDFKQSGAELQPLISKLFDSTVESVVAPMLRNEPMASNALLTPVWSKQ